MSERDAWVLSQLQKPGVVARFRKRVPEPSPDGCQIWQGATYARSGYGRFSLATGRRINSSVPAHRFSLMIAAGAPPAEDLVAAHSCRNKNCVAPAHLRWATVKENAADRRRDGTLLFTRGESHALHVLTERQVAEIRSLYAAGGISQRELSRRYGVVQSAISNIINFRRWQHTPETAS